MYNYAFLGRVFFNNTKTLLSKIPAHRKVFSRHCTIRRALLYVPGSDLHKLEKSLGLEVDCIIMDCEDGVAENQKEVARQTIRQLLDKGPVTTSNPEWSVRINPVQSPELCEADLEALLSAQNLPASLCLPKVNNVDQLQWFAEKVWNLLVKRPENDRGPLKLLMLIESAIAFVNLTELCKKVLDLATMAPIVPVGLVLGSDDLLASLGATRTKTGIEILYARQKMVMTAKAFGFQAIDMVYLNYNDSKGFVDNCQEGYLLGFTGKQVIHPAQVTLCQEAFVPSRAKLKWAKGVMKSFNINQERGQGAFTFENAMIDMPTVKQAENILKVAKAAGKLNE